MKKQKNPSFERPEGALSITQQKHITKIEYVSLILSRVGGMFGTTLTGTLAATFLYELFFVDFPEVVSAAADYDYSAVLVELIKRTGEGKVGGENIPLNYNNGGFVYTYSENTELLPEDVKAAAQAALDSMVAAPNTVDFSGVELK